MKSFILGMILAAAMLIAPASVSADKKPEPAQHPPIYKCHASSDYAWGIGYGPTRRRAGSMALYQCARRTPQGEACVLDWCRRIR